MTHDTLPAEDIGDAETRQIAFMTKQFARHDDSERQGYQSALFDAAHLVDAICRDILAKHTRGGRLTRQGAELQQALKRAGDAVWEAKKRVDPERACAAGIEVREVTG